MKLAFLKPSLNWLLVFVPVALVLRLRPHFGGDTALFICACLAIVPLAGIMGRATEVLAHRLGHGIGGLLNATFGNAAELIIALMALSKGLIGIVKASIVGSILGNILFVLGCSFLAGGLKFRQQTFNQTAARASASSLSIAGIALVIPTVFHVAAETRPGGWSPETEQKLSLAIAIVLFACYSCVLLFELVTHRRLYAGRSNGSEEEEELDSWSVPASLVILLISTGFVALMSEFLVTGVEGARRGLQLTEVFIGVIVVAIVGNAAEHSTAIWMAMKDKMSISLGIAMGSGLQIALFVAPLLVFVSYFIGQQPIDLEFSLPEVVAVVVSVYLVFQVSGDGRVTWIEGVQLLSVYLIFAILFFFLPAH